MNARRIAGCVLFVSLLFGTGVRANAEEVPTPLLTPSDPSLTELSGIAADPTTEGFWVHQDAGKPSVINLVDPDGAVAGQVNPAQGVWEDPEDLGVGPIGPNAYRALYVADTGDAAAVRSAAGQPSRTQFSIARAPIPADPVLGGVDERFQSLGFSYPDGANRNSEALVVDPASGDCWVVTKTTKGTPAEVWAAPAAGFGSDDVTVRKIAEIPIDGISGGSADPFGRFVVLRDATTAYLYPVDGAEIATAFDRKPTAVALPKQPQGEGITVTRGGDALVVISEGAGQPFWRVALPSQFVDALPPAPQTQSSSSPRSILPVAVGLPLLVAGVGIVAYGIRRNRRRDSV